VFIRRVVAFFGRKSRSSGVLSRFSAEKRVHPACCRVFHAKNAFIQRAVAFFRRKTRFSDENRVYPLKNTFFTRKSRFSDENRVFLRKTAASFADSQGFVRCGEERFGDRAGVADCPDDALPIGSVVKTQHRAVVPVVRPLPCCIAAAKSKVGSSALTTYAVARVLAKRPETADLLPHVEDMSKALGRRGRKSKSQPAPKAATPDTTEQPSSVTSSPTTATTK